MRLDSPQRASEGSILCEREADTLLSAGRFIHVIEVVAVPGAVWANFLAFKTQKMVLSSVINSTSIGDLYYSIIYSYGNFN